jgi:4a-hydroxytetrahydrobiopterin dehydratase
LIYSLLLTQHSVKPSSVALVPKATEGLPSLFLNSNITKLEIRFFNMAQLLTEAEIQEQAGGLSRWTVEQNKLQTSRTFKDFIQAIEFVNKLVEPSESAGHHPDIEISYNKVKITLTTHDAGGLTQKDFDVAREISQIN